jgi:hypothetical protein
LITLKSTLNQVTAEAVQPILEEKNIYLRVALMAGMADEEDISLFEEINNFGPYSI